MKSFLRCLLLLAIACCSHAAPAAGFPDPIGLQLESFSGQMHNDRAATLEKVHKLGFKYVELVGDYGVSPVQLKAELHAHSLTAVSAHFPYERFRDDPAGLASEAVALGLSYIGCASIPHHDPVDEQSILAAAAVFNHAGEIMAAHGIQFFYHPHGYEFKPNNQGTFFDLLMEKTNPKFVHFQMDVFWIVYGRQDPVKLLQRYQTRWISMHLKDMKRDAPTGFNGHTAQANFVPLGRGQIDIVNVMRTAHQLGIRSYFIEDESSSPDTGIPESLQFLRSTAW